MIYHEFSWKRVLGRIGLILGILAGVGMSLDSSAVRGHSSSLASKLFSDIEAARLYVEDVQQLVTPVVEGPNIVVEAPATDITITNTSEAQPLYGRVYTRGWGIGKILPGVLSPNLWYAFGPIYKLGAQPQLVKRPYFTLGEEATRQRVLVYTTVPERLETVLEKEAQERYPSLAIGRNLGKQTSFTITSYEEQAPATSAFTVVNTSSLTLYGAVYRAPLTSWQDRVRISDIVVLAPGATQTFMRPLYKGTDALKNSPRLYVSDEDSSLNERLPYDAAQALISVDVSPLRGKTFYLGGVPLAGYSEVGWRLNPLRTALEDVARKVLVHVLALVKPAIELLSKKLSQGTVYPWSTQQVTVRKGTELHPDEVRLIEQRIDRVQPAVERLTGQTYTTQTMPRIGVVYSGGGMRAATGASGAQEALGRSGILDAALYHSVLSGSTWYLAPYMTSGQSVSEFNTWFINRVARGVWGLFQNIVEAPLIIAFLTVQTYQRLVADQKLSLVEFYGLMLSYNFLRGMLKNAQGLGIPSEDITMVNQVERVMTGTVPFPIYTACIGETGGAEQRREYRWWEITPIESGSWYLKSFVPTWGFGRRYVGGYSTDFTPPYRLGYILGICGSAISASVRDAYEQSLKESSYLLQQLGQAAANTVLGDLRIIPAEVPNIAYGIPNVPFNDKPNLTLVDAGVASGVPIHPLLHPQRRLDVLIVVDMSGTVSDARELRAGADNARAHGYPFPKNIDYTLAGTSRVSVWGLDEPGYTGPVIIYIPRSKNDAFDPKFDPSTAKFTATANFVYTSAQATRMKDLMDYNIREAVPVIKETLQKIGTRKLNTTPASGAGPS